MSQLYENNAKCRRQSDSAANNEKSARNQNRKTAESQERREMSWEHIIVQFLVAVPATIRRLVELEKRKKADRKRRVREALARAGYKVHCWEGGCIEPGKITIWS